MSPELRYRRILRLLPSAYRQLWEEDMVSAFLDSGAARPSLGERFSVIWLALRLRLNGSHASARAQLWYQAVLGVALLGTLREALIGSVLVAGNAGWMSRVQWGSWPDLITAWSGVVSLFWVVAFVCLASGRLVAARVFTLVALADALGATQFAIGYLLHPLFGTGLPDLSTARLVWLALIVAAVFRVPKGFRPSRWWLAGYLGPALLLVPALLATGGGRRPHSWTQFTQLVNIGTLMHVAVILAMAAALLRARYRLWLLPLAGFGAAVALPELLHRPDNRDVLFVSHEYGAQVWTWVAAVQLVLAAVCAVVGIIALLRTPTIPPSGSAEPGAN